MLRSYYQHHLIETGCDEAGRGCFAGPVYAAAVVLPPDFRHEWLNDSKQLSETQRYQLRPVIEKEALSWAVGWATHAEIDTINILNASFLAMHRAINKLSVAPELLLIDGNRFKKYPNTDHRCIIGGDGLYLSIAAASVLAKTYRDDYMLKLHEQFPSYNWKKNKGYGTKEHRKALMQHGITPFHRRSYRLFPNQLKIEF